MFKIWSAFYSVDEYIFHTKSMDTVLNYRIVSISRIWSTMSHDKKCIFFT